MQRSKKRTTGPRNEAMKEIPEVDKWLHEQYAASVINFGDVKHLRQLRRGYVKTIEAPED